MAMNEQALAEELRAMREEMRAMREQMSAMIGDTNRKLDVIGSFVAAINEAQTFEKTMHAVENVTKDVTGCDKADFIAEENGKFFSTDGETRTYILPENADEIKRVMETGRISVRGDAAIIPVQSGNDSSVGVIIAEKRGGFDSAELAQLESGSTVMNTVTLAIEKEMNHRMAVTDELTALKNRDGLNEYLKNTLCDVVEENPISILMCDIDHFKSVNDTYGHDAGDVVLRGVADIISGNTRGGYDSAFRMGGEEMACILCCDVNEATKIAERIRTEVENSVFDHNGQEIKVTLSIGVHQMNAKDMIPENARSVFDAELKRADNAAYEAKESGRNQVVISADSVKNIEQPPSYYNKEGYRNIENKTYINCDAQTAYNISDMAKAMNVEHSVKYHGSKSTVTVDGIKDRAFTEDVRRQFDNVRISGAKTEKNIQQPYHKAQPEQNRVSEENNQPKKEEKPIMRDNSNTIDKPVNNRHFVETIGKMSDWADKVIEKAEQLKAKEQEQNKGGAER